MRISLSRFIALCILALCTVMSTHALAAVPGVPQEATARYSWQYDANTYAPVVYITWLENSADDNATSFQVYHARGLHDTYTGFEAIGEPVPVQTNDSTDTLQNWYSLTIPMTPNDVGDHSFYVTAINADGESAGSNIVTLSIIQSYHIVFTAYPRGGNVVAERGEPLTFTVQAVTSPAADRDIRYSIAAIYGEPLPSGLEIDAETGVIHWTPMHDGLYQFYLRAELADDETVSTTVIASISVKSCLHGIPISGVVKDEQGELIMSGLVQALVAVRDTMNNDTTVDSSFVYVVRYRAPIGRDGRYSMNVEAGEYILFASGDDFVPEYYNDASTADEAFALSVVCEQDISADMTVSRVQRFTVSGTVKHAKTGEGLVAGVTFVGYDNSVPTGSQQPRYFHTGTWLRNQIGEYSITLPGNYTYIAYATIHDTIEVDTLWRVVSQIQYFDHKQDASEATAINLTANRDNVNFDFEDFASFNNGIHGRVVSTDGDPVSAYVVAYRMGNHRAYASAITDGSTGTYELNNIQPGQYVLAAYPIQRGEFLPGYYKVGEIAVPSWQEASRVAVNAQSIIPAINIVLPKAVGLPQGGGIVQGKVRNHSGSIGKGDGDVLGTDALAGALVTLIDGQGVSRKYDLSDNGGGFSLNDLPVGTYTILIDKVGFESYTITVTISDENEFVPVDAALEPESVTGVDEPVAGNALFRTFPNPATNDVTVSFPAKAGDARITIVSQKGAEVLSVRMATMEGTNQTTVNTSTLASGSYFVHIVAGNHIYTLPLQIVR